MLNNNQPLDKVKKVSCKLPFKMHPSIDKFENLGFVFHIDKGNECCMIDLPRGWSIEDVEWMLQSYILDEKNRKRATIFFADKYYDRVPYISLEYRYRIVKDNDLNKYKLVDFDDSIIYFHYSMIVVDDYYTKNYPDRMDPLAYWD